MSSRESVSHLGPALVLTSALAAGVGMMTMPAAPASAQMMVCQTPAFWCSFPGDGPSRLNCYCMTYRGPVPGYTINPREVARLRSPLPPPPDMDDLPVARRPYDPPVTRRPYDAPVTQRPYDPPPVSRRPAPQEEVIDLEAGDSECFNGLGNCTGSFSGAVDRSRRR